MAADLHIHVFDGCTENDLCDYKKIASTPNVHVGEVSWLKAALLDDSDRYIPSAVQQVTDIIGEDLPVVDDAMIARIADAMKAPNATSYTLNSAEEVLTFLKQHKGKRVFTVSW